jgi:hypothetical protein
MPMSNDTKRRKTRYRGISYRERKDGTRTYSIYWRGNYTAVEGVRTRPSPSRPSFAARLPAASRSSYRRS